MYITMVEFSLNLDIELSIVYAYALWLKSPGVKSTFTSSSIS